MQRVLTSSGPASTVLAAAIPATQLPTRRYSLRPDLAAPGASRRPATQGMTGDTAFWVPGKVGESKVVLDKPDMSTLCPATGDKLKLKVRPGRRRAASVSGNALPSLAAGPRHGLRRSHPPAALSVCLSLSTAPACHRIPISTCPHPSPPRPAQDLFSVRFTPVPDGGPHEYMDPVTKDIFINASRLVVLKPTGGWRWGWCGVVWCGVVWCGVVWRAARRVWHGERGGRGS